MMNEPGAISAKHGIQPHSAVSGIQGRGVRGVEVNNRAQGLAGAQKANLTSTQWNMAKTDFSKQMHGGHEVPMSHSNGGFYLQDKSPYAN